MENIFIKLQREKAKAAQIRIRRLLIVGWSFLATVLTIEGSEMYVSTHSWLVYTLSGFLFVSLMCGMSEYHETENNLRSGRNWSEIIREWNGTSWVGPSN